MQPEDTHRELGAFSAPFALTTAEGEISARRLALLAAIGDSGSISAAARQIGMTYKAAWDAVEAMNNLAGRTLVQVQHGGRGGGGARLSDDGARLVTQWRQLGSLQQRWLRELAAEAAGSEQALAMIGRVTMRSSARNVLHGVVDQVTPGAVNSEVSLRLPGGDQLHVIVTRESAEELELAAGREVQALIKASWIILAMPGDGALKTSARNQLCGHVRRVVPGEINAEVVLEIGGGNTLAATITRASLDELQLQEGQPVCALIKASHIILGVQA